VVPLRHKSHFREFLLYFASFVDPRNSYSKIPFSLLEDRVKVGGLNLLLLCKLMPEIQSLGT